MARAIDGGTLRDNLTDIYGDGNRLVYLNDVLDLIDEQPTLTPPNEPLTLEQLREMDGEPVYMVDLTGGTLWDQWIIFERHTYDGFIPRGGGYFGCASYGGKWLAYRRPPEGEV